jgi:hypothetical protein
MTYLSPRSQAYARLVEMRNQPDNVYVFITEYHGVSRRRSVFTGKDIEAMTRDVRHFPGIVAIERIDTPGVDVWTRG